MTFAAAVIKKPSIYRHHDPHDKYRRPVVAVRSANVGVRFSGHGIAGSVKKADATATLIQGEEARPDVFDSIERFYPTRRHSTLGYVSLIQIE